VLEALPGLVLEKFCFGSSRPDTSLTACVLVARGGGVLWWVWGSLEGFGDGEGFGGCGTGVVGIADVGVGDCCFTHIDVGRIHSRRCHR